LERAAPARFDQWQNGAVVTVTLPDRTTMRRFAVFVYPEKAGFAWVEAHYTDPMGAATPAMHRTAGADWSATVEPYSLRTHEAFDGDLHLHRTWLAAQGRSWAQEYKRVRTLLGKPG
jgi:hypothetical protein